MFDRILIPLDGSARAELILAQLSPLLKREQTEVVLVQGVYSAPSLARMDSGKLANEHGQEADAYLRQVVGRLVQDGIRARYLVKKEPPEEAILRTAHEGNFDLIAMTTHGRMGFERWMMGSVTEQVLRAAEVPLLVLHSFKRTPEGASVPLAGEPVSFKSILVPIDVGQASLDILPWIERMAKVFGSEIALLHVMDQTSSLETPATLKAAEEKLTGAALTVRPMLVQGQPASKIVETATTGGFDLLAMATHGRSTQRRWVMGSFAERILRASPIPMFVVPSAPLKK
jgi:nucleotide-binding universal stress UspA family protein